MSVEKPSIHHRIFSPSLCINDLRRLQRVLVFIVVFIMSGALVDAGCSLETLIVPVLEIGWVATTIAQWLVDGLPLPSADILGQGVRPWPRDVTS